MRSDEYICMHLPFVYEYRLECNRWTKGNWFLWPYEVKVDLRMIRERKQKCFFWFGKLLT